VNKEKSTGKRIPRIALNRFLEMSKIQAKRTRNMEKTVQNVHKATQEYVDLVNQIDAYLEHFYQTPGHRGLYLRWFKNEVEKILHSMSAYASAVKSLDLRNNHVTTIEEVEECLDAMQDSHVTVVNTFTYNFPRWVEFVGVDASELRAKFEVALNTMST
jgi:hypothetical protein